MKPPANETPAERAERTGVLLAELRTLAARLNRVADTLARELVELGIEPPSTDDDGDCDTPC